MTISPSAFLTKTMRFTTASYPCQGDPPTVSKPSPGFTVRVPVSSMCQAHVPQLPSDGNCDRAVNSESLFCEMANATPGHSAIVNANVRRVIKMRLPLRMKHLQEAMTHFG